MIPYIREEEEEAEEPNGVNKPGFGVSAAPVLVAIVVLSWSYVIYASRVAAHWLLETRTAALRQD
ncbi:Hypothetical protein SMAX5B_004495 [Scophthalmus maximus]|uniref:Uncharacterized protein n=1 Tax=Scophthalmus maximus TaxID=52904 RepID=A0A2U9B068_SCOMX|nr:Hypothetical protein SMAX5B_004495 [Scophthalmus maximus]